MFVLGLFLTIFGTCLVLVDLVMAMVYALDKNVRITSFNYGVLLAKFLLLGLGVFLLMLA